ncbi:hypothetical protein BDW69DRAFT_187152 [Aspergillus filifer]
MFATASLVALLSLAKISDNALPREKPEFSNHKNQSHMILADIKAIFTVIRGVEAIVKHNPTMWETLSSSPYSPAMIGHRVQYHQAQDFGLPVEIQSRYNMLRVDCLESLLPDDEPDNKRACLDAISWLEIVHRELLYRASASSLINSDDTLEREWEPEPDHLVKWFALVSSDFVSMLQKDSPAALVILGEFFGLLRLLESRWFLKNVSNNTLAAIKEIIDPRGLAFLLVKTKAAGNKS